MTPNSNPGTVRIGLSGWSYSNFRGKFYPRDLASGQWLGYLATQMPTVEINSSFYRLQRASTYAKWAGMVPPSFVFAVKGWRMVTHMRKLNNVAPDVANFLNTCVPALGTNMGPVLWQLPPSYKFNEETLETFFSELPSTHGEAAEMAQKYEVEAPPAADPTEDTQQTELFSSDEGAEPKDKANPDQPLRYALEPRNASFDDPAAISLLEKYDIAMVQSNSNGKFPEFNQVTTDFTYVRLHGAPRMYYSSYSAEALQELATKIEGWKAQGRDCFIYFDNTAAGHAPNNALALTKLVEESD